MNNFRNVMMFKRPDFGATIGKCWRGGEAAGHPRRRDQRRGWTLRTGFGDAIEVKT
jgi:hypothetical protein